MSNQDKPLFLFREYKAALDQCIGFAQFAEPGEIAFCIGPSGAGKTSLSRTVGIRTYGEPSQWPRFTIPFIRIIADNPDRGYFSPKELSRNMLAELRDPFRTALRSDAGLDEATSRRIETFMKQKRTSEPEMRHVIQNIGFECGLKLIIVDEANLLALTHRYRTPTDYLESLRTLGKICRARVMLFGTMDMLELRGFSAQLNRAATYIHVDRMRCEDERGKAEFLEMLEEVERWYDLDPGVLVNNPTEVLNITYGIPGEIDALIRRAKMRSPAPIYRPTWEIVKEAAASDEEIGRMREEADLIDAVLNDRPLSERLKKVVTQRKSRRMKPRRLFARGEQA